MLSRHYLEEIQSCRNFPIDSRFSQIISCYIFWLGRKCTIGWIHMFVNFSGLAGNAQSDESTCLWIITSLSIMSHSVDRGLNCLVYSVNNGNIWLNFLASNLLTFPDCKLFPEYSSICDKFHFLQWWCKVLTFTCIVIAVRIIWKICACINVNLDYLNRSNSCH